MATAVAATSIVSNGAFLGSSVSRKPVSGLPMLRASRVVCRAESSKQKNPVSDLGVSIAAAATTLVAANPALALVDERLSGEGTGLGLGVDAPGLGWVLVIVPFIIWGFFYTFSKTLPSGEDDGGLSL